MQIISQRPSEEENVLPRLLEEINQLNNKLHELSVFHYRKVVDARESLSRCTSTGIDLERKVESATNESLPKLRHRLAAFQDLGRKLCQEHKKTSVMIDLNGQLIDLLQIPSLMETCVRSGATEEALELFSFAHTLRIRHRAISALNAPTTTTANLNNMTGALLIERVVQEVENSALIMRKQLLQQLRTQIDIPTSLRLLSYLKRLDSDEKHIALMHEFLAARDAYLMNQYASVVEVQDLPYQICLKHVAKNRSVWSEVISQFQAVFGGPQHNYQLLAHWIRAKVRRFLFLLENEFVGKVENCGELATVYEACCSFSQSLGIVGVDFRSVLQPLFVHRVKFLVFSQWDAAFSQATDAFCKFPIVVSFLIQEANASATSTSTQSHDEDGGGGSGTGGPSPLFLQFPVLVELVNNLLRCFNDLRSFACLNIVTELATELMKKLETWIYMLEAYQPTPPHSQDDFFRLLDVVAHQFLPLVSRTFARVFDYKKAPLLVDTGALHERIKKRMMIATPSPPQEI